MQLEAVHSFLIVHWIALLAGLLGLAMRASRVPLPNGGAEPRSVWAHAWRLLRVWIEATGGAFVAALLASVFMIKNSEWFKVEASSMVLAVAVFLGAAASDLWAKWGTDPRKIPADIAAATSGLVDVWRRFRGRASDDPT